MRDLADYFVSAADVLAALRAAHRQGLYPGIDEVADGLEAEWRADLATAEEITDV